MSHLVPLSEFNLCRLPDQACTQDPRGVNRKGVAEPQLLGELGKTIPLRQISGAVESTEQALYEALWAAIGQALPSQTKRIISPDGQLNFISFATLLTKNKQFLAERYSVQYVTSA